MSVQLRLLEDPDGSSSSDTARGRLWRGRRGASRVTDPRQRRLLGVELLLILGLFPLAPAERAIKALVQRIETHANAVTDVFPAVDPKWLAFGLEFCVEASALCVAGIVLYLLVRGDEGVGAIGLDRRRWRMDLALVFPVFMLTQAIPQTAGSAFIHVLGWQSFSVDPNVHISEWLGTTLGFVGGITAGIVEEVVVLGFLVHRLEQRGWNARWIVLAAVAVRVSYHLYYGWGAIPIALWAAATVFMYRRVRRLMPFILCHIIWDCSATLLTNYRMAWIVLAIVFLVLSTEAYKKWGSWNAGAVTSDR